MDYLITAFTIINSQTGYEERVYEKLLGITGVKEAYRTFRVYDIILRLEEMDLESLLVTIATHIRSIKEILSTMTLIIFS